MAITVEYILNIALRKIKYPTPIGSIMEGSPAARVALEIYGQTRDALSNSRDWSFLRRQVSLGNPIKTAPPGGYGTNAWDPTTAPPPPWVYSYQYPDDCLEVRSLQPTPIFIPVFTPQFTRFVTAQDSVSHSKVVLTNLYQPLAVITARVTDPNEWQDAEFLEALIDALAVNFMKYAPNGDVNQIQLAERDAAVVTDIASVRRG